MQPSLPDRIETGCLIDLACAAWKLRRQVFDSATDEPKEDSHQLASRVTAIWNSLSELGLQIEDHTGNVVDSDVLQSAEILAWEFKEAILQETVIETVRPTVYLNGKKMLTGLVVVSMPTRLESKAQRTA